MAEAVKEAGVQARDCPQSSTLSPVGARHKGPDLVRMYLDELDWHPVLTRDEEVRLGQAIEAGLDAQRQLAAASAINPRRCKRLGQLVSAGLAARAEFVQANLRLVVSIAKHWQHRGVDLADLIQEGNLGLLRAIDGFDWRRGTKCSTYATWWIENAMARAVAESRTVHLPRQRRHQAWMLSDAADRLERATGRPPGQAELAAETGIGIQDVAMVRRVSGRMASLSAPIDDDGNVLGDLIADSAQAVDDDATSHLLPQEIDRLLGTLSPSAARVLRLRFGIGDNRPRTAAEVGTMLSVSPERVSQIERRALIKLRHLVTPEFWAS